MNMSELEKFILAAESAKKNMDSFTFDPINETATIAKDSQSVIIDLTRSVNDQNVEFQSFLDGL